MEVVQDPRGSGKVDPTQLTDDLGEHEQAGRLGQRGDEGDDGVGPNHEGPAVEALAVLVPQDYDHDGDAQQAEARGQQLPHPEAAVSGSSSLLHVGMLLLLHHLRRLRFLSSHHMVCCCRRDGFALLGVAVVVCIVLWHVIQLDMIGGVGNV